MFISSAFLGPGSAAQQPDMNRVMEAIVEKLLEVYRGPDRSAKKDRYALVLAAYSKICSLFYASPALVATTIQLAGINRHTLLTWYVQEFFFISFFDLCVFCFCILLLFVFWVFFSFIFCLFLCFREKKKTKTRELQVVQQASTIQRPSLTADEPALPARETPVTLDVGTAVPQHQFTLPENKAGCAKKGRKQQTPMVIPSAKPLFIQQAGPQPFCYFLPSSHSESLQGASQVVFRLPYPPPHPPSATVTSATVTAPPSVSGPPAPAPPPPKVHQLKSRTTDWRHRKRAAEPAETKPKKQRKTTITCSHCKKDRFAGEDHQAFMGAWWCRETSDKTFEEWLAIQHQRPVKKKVKKGQVL